MRKKSHTVSTIRDLGMNTFFGFAETWLKHYDHEKLWHLRNESFVTFRVDPK